MMAYAQISEVRDPVVGPQIVKEEGDSYVIQSNGQDNNSSNLHFSPADNRIDFQHTALFSSYRNRTRVAEINEPCAFA
jgi:hypothetical protein